MYRNDHDAALARIDALEGEVKRLQGELDRLEPPPPALAQQPESAADDHAPRATSVGKTIATFIFVMIWALCLPFGHHYHHHYTSRPVPRVHYTRPASPPIDRDYRELQRAISANLHATEAHVSQ